MYIILCQPFDSALKLSIVVVSIMIYAAIKMMMTINWTSKLNVIHVYSIVNDNRSSIAQFHHRRNRRRKKLWWYHQRIRHRFVFHRRHDCIHRRKYLMSQSSRQMEKMWLLLLMKMMKMTKMMKVYIVDGNNFANVLSQFATNIIDRRLRRVIGNKIRSPTWVIIVRRLQPIHCQLYLHYHPSRIDTDRRLLTALQMANCWHHLFVHR